MAKITTEIKTHDTDDGLSCPRDKYGPDILNA